ncbi:MAG TPA: EpsD family peptidyl-prolyl cis-trans isomerase [Burkholderiales bacterium]|nr:EpsD family peptidyl-prolyl cis-trans isomerase [Burkholderiales bacterium]
MISTYAVEATAALALVSALALAGCTPGGENKTASQVAAKVNGDQITVQQISLALSRAGSIPEAQQKQAQQQVLERLIDQQLLVQQAVQQKLDRDPHVVAQIDAAKRQILAQAYLERVMQDAPKSTPEEISAFYSQHPELFQERRLYRFKEMAIAAPADLQPLLRAEVIRLDKRADKDKTMARLALWLQSQNVKFQTNLTTQAAEQLPTELIGRIHQMKDGDLLMMPRGNTVLVSQLDKSQSAPLTEQQASASIEQFLQRRKRLDLSSDALKGLRTAAKLEYFGDFAQKPGSAEAAAQPKSAVQPQAAQPPAGDTEKSAGGQGKGYTERDAERTK